MSYQMEKIRRMAAEKAMEAMKMMKDVQPELLEEAKIDNEKMSDLISDFDFRAPVDNEKLTAGILEMFKSSAQHGGVPNMKFELEVNDKVFKVNVELAVE